MLVPLNTGSMAAECAVSGERVQSTIDCSSSALGKCQSKQPTVSFLSQVFDVGQRFFPIHAVSRVILRPHQTDCQIVDSSI